MSSNSHPNPNNNRNYDASPTTKDELHLILSRLEAKVNLMVESTRACDEVEKEAYRSFTITKGAEAGQVMSPHTERMLKRHNFETHRAYQVCGLIKFLRHFLGLAEQEFPIPALVVVPGASANNNNVSGTGTGSDAGGSGIAVRQVNNMLDFKECMDDMARTAYALHEAMKEIVSRMDSLKAGSGDCGGGAPQNRSGQHQGAIGGLFASSQARSGSVSGSGSEKISTRRFGQRET
ncbi:hypothetical protein BGW39_010521 [Mortierella sp. 14UC]|nr:hypothetical protein BGW39_010521 [Mortierella sp. 14UC]